MKSIVLLFSSALLLFACCKHHLVQPVMPTSKNADVTVEQDTLENIVFDYSIDTVQCDTAHFKNIIRNNGLPRLDIPANPSHYSVPTFTLNGQNKDELYYFHIEKIHPDKADGTMTWYSLNLLTKEKKKITYLPIAYQVYNPNPKSGWFFEKNNEWKIWKIKPNGDSLTFLANSSSYASWNHDGSQMAYYDAQYGPKLYLADATGKPFDTIVGEPADYFDWTKKDIFARQRGDGSIVSYNTKDRSRRLLVPALGMADGFCWLGDWRTMVVSTHSGLYIADTETLQYRKIRCAGYHNSWYTKPQYSKKHHKIFAIKYQLVTYYLFDMYLISMNIDGSDEQIEAQSIY